MTNETIKNQKGETSLMQTLMVAALIVAAFFIGMLWTKVRVYEKGGNAGLAAGTGQGANQVPPTNYPTPGAPSAPIELEPVSDQDHIRGNKSARVALVEYSDLECPFCKTFHPTALKALDEYGDQLMWVFRHFPLDQLHSKARLEAAAAECAFKQGGHDKFWAYIDKVYEITPANNGLNLDELPKIAQGLGLNVDQFNTCYSNKETVAIVEDDYQSGVSAGINGTPGNILLDTKTGKTFEVPGAVPYEQLKQMIDTFIAGLDK